MPTLRKVFKVIQNLNRSNKTKCLLFQCEICKGATVLPVLYFSDKKPLIPPEQSKVKCKEEPKSPELCVKAETVKVLSATDSNPKVCGKPCPEEVSLRPYTNPCPQYPPCDPCIQPVHPCREKPPRIPIIKDDIREELSLRAKRILLALFSLLGGVIAYKALTKPEDSLVTGGKKRPRCVLRPQFITKTPENKEDIPTQAPYLIVGGGTAAFSAFRTIKSLDPTAKILVISSEPYFPYMRPPLAKDLISGPNRNLSRELCFKTDKGQSRSIFYEPDEFFTPINEFETSENGGISVVKGWTVESVDPDKKVVSIKGGPKINYGKCLLATGSRSKSLEIFECNTEDVAEKVTNFRTVYDYMEIEDVINCGAKKIAVIGSSNVACELAASLTTRDVEVLQIFKENGVLSKLLPSYLSDWVSKKMQKEGVKLMKNTVIEDAMIAKGQLKLITKERKGIFVDHVVVVSDFIPNTEIADNSGLEVDQCRGGFVVNPELRIRTDLYAAGDCASFYDPKLGKRRRLDNHDHAISTGRIAGENMVGQCKTYNKESTNWTNILPGVEFETFGCIDSSLATVGVFLDEKNDAQIVDPNKKKPEPTDDYSRGVLFYLVKQKVVGVTVWNMMGRSMIAERVLWSKVPYEHLDESAKLFAIHRRP